MTKLQAALLGSAATIAVLLVVAACSPMPVVAPARITMITEEATPLAVEVMFKDVCLGQAGRTTIHRIYYTHDVPTTPFAVTQVIGGGYGAPIACKPTA